MNEKRLYSYDKGNNKILCNLNDICDFNVSNVFQLLNSLADENEQLKKEKEGWKLSTCRYINKDSILMMDCQIVQEALFELERLIEQDTEQKKKFNDVEEKFKSLVNHYIK